MKPFLELTSRVVPLVRDDIDTDQIIAARYLTVTDRSGLGEGLFAAWREDPSSPLNHRDGASILLAGHNFGCGSSREHAPWALLAGGYRCVIARSFADIFRQNAQRNGLLPVALEEPAHARLLASLEMNPALDVRVDLFGRTVSWRDHLARFEIDDFARECLLGGVDSLGYLLAKSDAIGAFEARRGAA
ncbi:MAG: 3-isopropylmalate dehydratase small subunit [Sandaracinaceae bacterium]|nr:3-isopropylmalate dehydratase small subunit [Sandaracinaceae bacterium]